MINKEIQLLYEQIKDIRPDISIPLRLGEPLNHEKVKKLLFYMDKLIVATKNENYISKKLIALLWDLYQDFEADVSHKKLRYPDKYFMYLASISSKFSELVGCYENNC
ncbi:hypothetical protein [Pseudobacteroides cellulosolvens]|uniref:Uncharacterized protein n=1 Tax=Pseudobacteroides cellulosolvens ATCC 35603 = DSM 2933 TaxID=398512 RepID=A0A0L6JWH1_9FIRM|nr:hypothetical protein [Pseudobacteroides cellulosolvens]KNY30094.1 hypothetical protein Bccel_5371 [Pseudobacteroides cellulosolvens ATCC 35603 = DSM 2933]